MNDSLARTRAFFRTLGLPERDAYALPASSKRFPDGAHYRVEIPSTEGPRALAAILEEADRYGIVVHRVSQGSGVMLQTDDEIGEFVGLASDRRMEVSLFARPHAGWDVGAMAASGAGRVVAPRLRGQDQLAYCLRM